MKKAGVLLVCGLLAGSSIGVTPIFANEIGIVEEEFTTKTVNAATGGFVSYTSGIVDTTNPVAAEELLKKTSTMALEFEWQDENREEHSLTWTPQEKDIKEAGNYKIRPGFMMKSFYVHASEAQKLIKEQAGEEYDIQSPVYDEETKNQFAKWGWEGPVIQVTFNCDAGKDSSIIDNWTTGSGTYWVSNYTPANLPEHDLLTIEQVEEGLKNIELTVVYPDSASKEDTTITLDYIPGTVSDLYLRGSSTYGNLNLKPYFEQVEEEYNISLTGSSRSNESENPDLVEVYFGYSSPSDHTVQVDKSVSASVTETIYMPELPETLGNYILIDETTGQEIASGILQAKDTELTYGVEDIRINDSETITTIVGRAKLVNDEVKATVEKQTGIKAQSDFDMDIYGFEYRPVLNNETSAWTPYLTKGDAIYFYTNAKPAAEKQEMYRLYNPNSGEHFYTANAAERDHLKSLGWKDEGTGWIAPATSDRPVYRVYNPNAGDHHYTMNKAEKDHLVSIGWNDEGIGWYSADDSGAPLYRQYNPNAKAGAHNYTTNAAERDHLVSLGWNDEGIGWYGTK